MCPTRRPFRTRFRSASAFRLKLAIHIKSPIHDAKGTESLRLRMELPLLVDTRFQVFSLPSPGCFSPFPRGTSPLSVSREYLGL